MFNSLLGDDNFLDQFEADTQVLYNNDGSLTDARFVLIDKWMSDLGTFTYFEIRGIVAAAANNQLKIEYPKVPFTDREVLLWSDRNDKNSTLLTPGGQAVSGEGTFDAIFGADGINPRTSKEYTIDERRGFLGNAAYRVKKIAIITGVSAVGLGVGYLFAKPYLTAKAKQLAK